MTDLFVVLADETRRHLLEALRKSSEGEISVSELVEQLGVSQPTVSKQLKVLREAGAVTVRLDGQHRYYHLAEAPFEEVVSWLAQFAWTTVPESTGVASSSVTPEISDTAVNRFGSQVGRTTAEVTTRVVTASATAVKTAQSVGESAAELSEKVSHAITGKIILPIKKTVSRG